ncbi:MAG: isoprenylcysteine carboxylmethyltransferase family protein [Patulibacter minatonensis]
MTSRRAAQAVVAALVASRLSEVRLAERNERAARAAGAVEHSAGHYPAFFLLHPAWLVGMLAEPGERATPPRLGWLALAAAAQPVRWWTMRALGQQWTTRILITPGAERVTSGPYRLTPHPAYLAVTAELLAAPLAVRAPRTAIAASVANALLLGLVRIPAERRAEATRDGLSAGRSPRPA